MRIWGVLNVTPDSFSDGGAIATPEAAVALARRMVADGAAVLDVGGESRRPFARPVSEAEEMARVLPVVEALRDAVRIPISVDTRRPAVFRAAHRLGASVWNDVTALSGDPGSVRAAADLGVTVVLMHMRGTPETMQVAPAYDDVVGDVTADLEAAARRAVDGGVAPGRIVLDPGIGFGKNLDHNIDLLRGVGRLRGLGFPLLVGASRKSFLGTLCARPDPRDRDHATTAVTTWLVLAGVDAVRVHDVRAAADAVRVAEALGRAGAGPAAAAAGTDAPT